MVADLDLAKRGFRLAHPSLGAEVLAPAEVGRLGAAVVDVALEDMSGHASLVRLILGRCPPPRGGGTA